MTLLLRTIPVVMAVLLSGCGWDCNAATCANGCCDSNNTCILNGGAARCGTAGASCQSCATCSLGICGCTAGLELSGGRCVCTARSCSGCCEQPTGGEPSCRNFTSQSPSACGTGGARCLSCGLGSSCTQGNCASCANYLERCSNGGCCSTLDTCSYRSSLGYSVCQ